MFDGTSARTTADCGCKGKGEDATLPVALGTCSAAAVFDPTAQQFEAGAAGFIWPAQQPETGAAA
ncbi:MAG: hypothetical protein ACLQPD_37045 [Desulfomonilaceae bacterium]